jgi:hypothetical protein
MQMEGLIDRNFRGRLANGSRLPNARRFVAEFLAFGLKEARACWFAGLFFAGIFLLPRQGGKRQYVLRNLALSESNGRLVNRTLG